MTKEERLKAAEYYPGVSYQQLFDHMIDEHGLTLLQGEMDEIIRIVKGAEAEAESKCNHELIDVSNKFIDGGYMCVICNMTFKAHVTTP